jgi:hypothetical protein
MLQPHSLLWHYLWVAPCVLQGLLALLMWKRSIHKQYPAFFVYIVFEAMGGAIIYALDNASSVSGPVYWRSYFAFLFIEAFIKFAVVGEVFNYLLCNYPPLGKLGKLLIKGVGILLILTATAVAAYSNPATYVLATRILARSVSIVQCGLILFLFVFAAHFHLKWNNAAFGITLGFGISASIYLAHWALMAARTFGPKSYLLDFISMAAYHCCVLIWCYYLLVPQKKPSTSADPLPENNLAVWNRELERLLQ